MVRDAADFHGVDFSASSRLFSRSLTCASLRCRSKELTPQYKNMKTFFVHTVRVNNSSTITAPYSQIGPQLLTDMSCFHSRAQPQPNRTYYLEDVERTSITWVDTIKRVQRM